MGKEATEPYGFVLRVSIKMHKGKKDIASYIAEVQYQAEDYKLLTIDQVSKAIGKSTSEAIAGYLKRLQESLPDHVPDLDLDYKISDEKLSSIAGSLLQ